MYLSQTLLRNMIFLIPFPLKCPVNPICLCHRKHVPWRFVDLATCVTWLAGFPGVLTTGVFGSAMSRALGALVWVNKLIPTRIFEQI